MMEDLGTTVGLTLALSGLQQAGEQSATLRITLRITNNGDTPLPVDGHPVIGLRLAHGDDSAGRCALRLTPQPGPTVLLEPGRYFELPVECPRLPPAFSSLNGGKLRAQVAVRIAGQVLLSSTHEYTMD